jgi:arabinogalactan oligomer / maltooligosaccharide transport system substrate-binding protein
MLHRRALTGSLLGLAGMAATPLLSGCSGDAEAGTTADLIVWHGYRGREKAALEAVVAVWNQRVPVGGRRVRTVAVPADAMPDKLSAAVPRGRGPDLFIFSHDRLGGWVEAGRTVEPVGFFVEDGQTDRYLPGMVDAMTYKDTLYALPLNYKSIALVYNKALVPTPPTTTADMVRMAKALTDQARGRFGLAYAYDDYFFHAALQNGFGGGVFDGAGDPALASAGNVAAGELLQRWKDADRILPRDPTASLITSLFNEGRAGMIFTGPWFLGEVSDKVDFGVAVLPGLSEAGGAPMRPWLSVEAVFLAAGKPRPKDAFDFAWFLTGPEGGAIMAREGGQLPAAAGAYNDPAIAADPVVAAFKAQAANGVAMPNTPEMTLVWSPADKAIKRMARSEATPAAALADLQREVAASINALRASGGRGA